MSDLEEFVNRELHERWHEVNPGFPCGWAWCPDPLRMEEHREASDE